MTTTTMSRQVYSRSTKLKKNGTVVGQVAVDHLVATRIKFILFYTASHQAVLEVEPPPHLARASNLDCHVDRVLRVIRCEMPSGVWRYSVTSPEAQRVSLLVLASPANTSGSPVRLSGGLVVSHLDDQLPIMRIFAEATQGDRAVPGLTVEATVFGPEGDPVTVVLLDNGAGADIQEGDGVYSRYFFELTHSGIYNVRLSAFGSWAQHGSKGEQEDHHKYVTRTAIAGSTLIHPNMTNQHGRDRDLLPPARIPDLLVVRTIREDKVVVLTWTASGDDLDKSRASKYLILLGHSVSDLMTHASSVNTLVQEDVIHGNLSSPKEFGEREYLALRIPSSFSKGQGFALMVMAVDEAGNKGKHSNYVTASFDHPTIHKKHWQEAQKMFQDVVIKRPRHRRQETNFLQRTKNINKMILPQEMEPLLTKHQRSKRSESKKDADTRADVSRNVNTGIAILLVGCVLAFLVTTLPTCLARRATRGERGKTDTGNLFQVKIDR
ncbi:hypothetical protein C0Q70_01827 [Pomacea canaliculata]|uniref:Calcium-activated chloride channel N-terminal domain-containing protein n=1 Tax=Pomacea canaliculata TaxID=400727 RepID=A0A2T7Q0K8_POMCA|nr:hypothetical protein C0Q70_01827 [Pomacea canaliculata]